MAVEARETERATAPVIQQGRWPQSKRPMSLGLMCPLPS